MRVVFPKSGREVKSPEGRLCFRTAVGVDEDPEIRLLCFGARAAFPILRKGENRVRLRTQASGGRAKVTFVNDFSPPPEPLPDARIVAPAEVFREAAPHFRLRTDEAATTMWWQISDAPDFHFVIPNFEEISRFSTEIVPGEMAATFFRNDIPYFMRAKVARNGFWGEWSPVVEFRVEKPPQPENIRLTVLPDGQLKLEWDSAPGEGVEFLVFGSSRLDFIPEIYVDTEVTKMLNSVVKESRPNKNLRAVTRERSLVLERPFSNFYRLVSRRGAMLSTPSTLFKFDAVEGVRIAPGKVLQTRWIKEPIKDVPLGYIDYYLARETDLPVPPPK